MKNDEVSGDVWLCDPMTPKVKESWPYLYQKYNYREEIVWFCMSLQGGGVTNGYGMEKR